MRVFSYLLAAILIQIASSGASQEKATAHFLGIAPAITVEPYYNKGELDINVFPVVYQLSIATRIDCRLSPILNLGIRNGKDVLSHVGLEIATPLFLKKKEEKIYPSKGFYLAPVLSFTRNNSALHYNLGTWIEPGYLLSISKRWSISFGLQVGGTYFIRDSGIKEWGNHFGFKIVIGRWF